MRRKISFFVKKSGIILFAIIPLMIIVAYFLKREYAQTVEVFAEQEAHSVFEDIYFSFYNDYLQHIQLVGKEEMNSYEAYIPLEGTDGFRIYFAGCDSVIINGERFSNGEFLPDFEQGVPYKIQAIGPDERVMEQSRITFYFQGTIPTVYVTTESGSMDAVNANKNEPESAFYAVYTSNGRMNTAGYCEIKGRGNTSWRRTPKPYNLNLEKTTAILGMEGTSDWALLANYGDSLPQLKNKVALELARTLDMSYTSEGEFVNLYLNGKYHGLYLLTSRVEVDESEYLLEFDARYEDEENYFHTENQDVVIHLPKKATDSQNEYIKQFIEEAEEAIYSENGRNSSTQKSYLDYIDLDSWAKMYTVQNYLVQWDVEYSSFFVYMLNQNSHLYAGPIWDFDLSLGKFYKVGTYPQLVENVLWLDDVKGEWLQALGRQQDFAEYTKQQYLTVISPAISQFLKEEYNDIVKNLDSAIEMDAARWDKVAATDQIESTYQWLLARQAFLDEYYKNPDNYYKVTFEFEWASVPYYVKKDTALNCLPCATDGSEHIVGWVDESQNAVQKETVITNDVTFYPVYEEKQ